MEQSCGHIMTYMYIEKFEDIKVGIRSRK